MTRELGNSNSGSDLSALISSPATEKQMDDHHHNSMGKAVQQIYYLPETAQKLKVSSLTNLLDQPDKQPTGSAITQGGDRLYCDAMKFPQELMRWHFAEAFHDHLDDKVALAATSIGCMIGAFATIEVAPPVALWLARGSATAAVGVMAGILQDVDKQYR